MSPAALGRKTNVDDLQALKAATRRLVDACGGQESAASITRVSHQTISRYRVPEQADQFIPADVLLDLEQDVGDPIVTRALAARQGWTLCRVKQATDVGSILQAMAAISKETSDVHAAIVEGLRDHKIDGTDGPEILKQIREAQAVLAGLDQAVRILIAGAAGSAQEI